AFRRRSGWQSHNRKAHENAAAGCAVGGGRRPGRGIHCPRPRAQLRCVGLAALGPGGRGRPDLHDEWLPVLEAPGRVDRDGDRDDLGGFMLVLLAALLRPESWPFLLVSAVLAWRRGRGARALVVAGLALVPVLWFGGEYLGSHDLFRGSYLAKASKEAVHLRR